MGKLCLSFLSSAECWVLAGYTFIAENNPKISVLTEILVFMAGLKEETC